MYFKQYVFKTNYLDNINYLPYNKLKLSAINVDSCHFENVGVKKIEKVSLMA